MLSADVAIVGAGPAGIVTALELARTGLEVVILDSDWKGRFRDALEEEGMVAAACETVGMSPQGPFEEPERDPDFARS